MRTPGPRRDEFRPEGDEQQESQGLDFVHEQADRFQARRIGPMSVLENHPHRRFAGNPFDPAGQRCKRSLPPLMRGEVQCGIAAVVRKGQHLGQKRGVLVQH